MTPDTILRLRAESLAATRTAACSRRIRRRAGMLALAALALAIIPLSTVSWRAPKPGFSVSSPPAAAPLNPHRLHIVRTSPIAVPRIAVGKTGSLIRFSTESASHVERIDNAGLVRFFPDRGVAFIQPEGELAKVVVF